MQTYTAAVAALASEAYPWHLNLPYSHGLDDRQLSEFIERSANQGLLWQKKFYHHGQIRILYVLSDVGGALWERERLPDWSNFLVASQATDGEARPGDRKASMALSVDEMKSWFGWGRPAQPSLHQTAHRRTSE